MRQPEVESNMRDGNLYITKFLANVADEERSGRQFASFETLAMLVLDENYNGKEFVMTNAYFADQLAHAAADETDEELHAHLKQQTQIVVPLTKNRDANIVAVFVDIFGNEFKQEYKH